MKPTIILASYIPTNEKDELDNRYPIKIEGHNNILDNITKNLPNNNLMVLVANDPENAEDNDLRARVIFESFRMSGIEFDNYVMLDNRNWDRTEELISSASLILLTGGKVYRQNEFFKKINLRDCIKKFNALVIGMSAGAMNLCDKICNFPEELVDLFEPRELEGMGFFNDYLIPHFDSKLMQYQLPCEELDIVNEYILPFSNEHRLVCLENEAYIILKNGTTQVVGECNVLYQGKLMPFGE